MTFISDSTQTGNRWRTCSFRAKIGGIALVVVAGAVSGRANQVATASNFGPFHVEAGELTMMPDAGTAALLGAYNPLAMNFVQEGSFQTFCVERGEYLTPSTTYDVTLNNITLFTGVRLTVGAAYLYQQFATGQLNYDYADSPAGSRTTGSFQSAYYLQHAIWFYMGEYNEVGNPYEQQVNGLFANPFAPDIGVHNVSILNLWTPGQSHDQQHAFQDVLIYSPVPEPAAALLALATLLAVQTHRRKS